MFQSSEILLVVLMRSGNDSYTCLWHEMSGYVSHESFIVDALPHLVGVDHQRWGQMR